mmetsp:Transcript_12728/g.47620  ORF Transcript_12728/g.47620 Transcript_12728/m.47620 type:complete len:332 (-) Transcript_12728:2360-3355(-)
MSADVAGASSSTSPELITWAGSSSTSPELATARASVSISPELVTGAASSSTSPELVTGAASSSTSREVISASSSGPSVSKPNPPDRKEVSGSTVNRDSASLSTSSSLLRTSSAFSFSNSGSPSLLETPENLAASIGGSCNTGVFASGAGSRDPSVVSSGSRYKRLGATSGSVCVTSASSSSGTGANRPCANGLPPANGERSFSSTAGEPPGGESDSDPSPSSAAYSSRSSGSPRSEAPRRVAPASATGAMTPNPKLTRPSARRSSCSSSSSSSSSSKPPVSADSNVWTSSKRSFVVSWYPTNGELGSSSGASILAEPFVPRSAPSKCDSWR